LFKGDHPDVAFSLYNLAAVFSVQGKYADAEIHALDALNMRKRMLKKDHLDICHSLNGLASLNKAQGRYTDAEKLFRDALDMANRLFRGDHPELATIMHNLADLYIGLGKYSEAETLFHDAYNMRKRLFKNDHPSLANSMSYLANFYKLQGKFTKAQSLSQDALDMSKRLFKGDHPDVAANMNHLAVSERDQGMYAEAQTLFLDALNMRRRLFKGDHPELALSLHELGALYQAMQKFADAETNYRNALDMRKRMFKGDNSSVAFTMNNLAQTCQYRGKYAEAETLFLNALDMNKRLYKGDNLEMAKFLNNLSTLYLAQGKYAEAETLSRESMGMYRRLTQSFAMRKVDGEALTLIASLPPTRDAFFTTTRIAKSHPNTVYPEAWASKGLISRVYEQHQQAARTAMADPKTAQLLAELADARCRRAELLLAPNADPATSKKLEEELKKYELKIVELNKTIKPLLPIVERSERLANAAPAELQKVLPSDAVLVDFHHFTFLEFEKVEPGTPPIKRMDRYLAFVLTRETVDWVELESSRNVETAIVDWRRAIESGKDIPSAIPSKVRELVWNDVRKKIPPSIKTVYISPDSTLCRLPWCALPGDRPGSILLDDFAVATIPHAQFLLDKLWRQDSNKTPARDALLVGGVKYDAELPLPAATSFANRGEILVKPDAKLAWPFLPGTLGELNGVSTAAERKKIPIFRIEQEKATATAILAELPKARYAHFATHGFFADPSFRSLFLLDEKDYEKSWRGERIGRAAKSPLLMTGLVLAGANNPKTPGRGIITGESLIDLDLSGLELAVLSACETGLGEVAGGEGTFGLQRAFHMAGARNVVATLWKVPDQSTAALMSLFYKNLWVDNL
jgi:CHAT domain-containing protein/tetratricopeptide (TPR) repeat protein